MMWKYYMQLENLMVQQEKGKEKQDETDSNESELMQLNMFVQISERKV